MSQFDYDDEDKDVKHELVIPKYTLLYEDQEVQIKQEAQEEKEEYHDENEEEKKMKKNQPKLKKKTKN